MTGLSRRAALGGLGGAVVAAAGGHAATAGAASVGPSLVAGSALSKAFAIYDRARAVSDAMADDASDEVYLPVIWRTIDALVEVVTVPCASVSEVGYKLHRLTLDQAMRDQLEHGQDRVAFLASLAAAFGISGVFGPDHSGLYD